MKKNRNRNSRRSDRTVILPFSNLTAQQRDQLGKDGVIRVEHCEPNTGIGVPFKMLTKAQKAAFAENAPLPPRRSKDRIGNRNPRKLNSGLITRINLNCGVGTLAVVQGSIKAVTDHIADRLPNKGAIVLHGLSSGLRDPIASVIYLDGAFKNFTAAAGEIPAEILKTALQHACHLNGVQVTMGWMPMYGALEGGLKTAVVQAKSMDAFEGKSDKDNLKAYLRAFGHACFQNGHVRHPKFTHDFAILCAIPLPGGIRTTYVWNKDEFAALPNPGITGDLRHSMVGNKDLLICKANGDCFYGITAEDINRYLARTDQKPAWVQSDKMGPIADVSLGVFNPQTKSYAVVVTVNNGKGAQFVPVDVTYKDGLLGFKADKNLTVDGKDVEHIPPLVRITRKYLAGVGRNPDKTAVAFIPKDDCPAGLTNMVNALMPPRTTNIAPTA